MCMYIGARLKRGDVVLCIEMSCLERVCYTHVQCDLYLVCSCVSIIIF